MDRIRPYEKNARKIPQVAIDKVALSLREFGWQQPIVVEENGLIVVGHVRRLGAIKNGWKEAPVWIARGLTPAQVRAYRLMDNRSHEDAKWDMGILTLELQDLKLEGLDLELTGFSGAERDRALLTGKPNENDVPAVPNVPTARPGDVWLCGPHRIICGDCTDPAVVARVLNGEAPLLMVTDPPYGVKYDASWRDGKVSGFGDGSAVKVATGVVPNDDRSDWEVAYRLFPGAVAYVWHASLHTAEVMRGLVGAGLEPRAQIIWRKQQPLFSRGAYHWQHEPCWYAVRKGSAANWTGDRKQSTVWDIQSLCCTGNNSEERTGHSTQKPVECMRRPMLNHESRQVYDPFLGSGTTMVAAESAGRVCLGVEIDPTYCDVAIARWQGLAGKEATLEGDGRTFAQVAEARKAPDAVDAGGQNA